MLLSWDETVHDTGKALTAETDQGYYLIFHPANTSLWLVEFESNMLACVGTREAAMDEAQAHARALVRRLNCPARN